MLVTLQQIIRMAEEGNYCIPAFNVYNTETVMGIMEAAQERKAPVILQLYPRLVNQEVGFYIAPAVIAAAQRADIPVCLHLDHAAGKEEVYKSLRWGFTGIMQDGSALSYEENVALTRKVVDYAHAHDVAVEAELGSLAATDTSHEGSADDREVYTDPDLAKTFVEKTGVDALAVSVGTVHGLYKGTPKIRQDILTEINEKTGIPLVMHGGSGIPEDMIKESIRNGISKINVNTEISAYTVDKTTELLAGEKKPHLAVVALKQQTFVKEVVQKYMRFFAC